MNSFCLKHQEKPAIGRCKLCLKPICEECKIEAKDGIFCSHDCMGKSEAQKENIIQTNLQSSIDKEKNKILSSIISFLMLAGGLIIAGYIAWTYVLPQPLRHQLKVFIIKIIGK